ncbi:MAG: ribonuclease P protein component [Spirochaetes bacterium]|nr:MAG: ribonuclease P protein component [Spirochaetota bacterium]
MKKIYSLKGRNVFKEVFTRGKRFNREGVQLIVLKHDGGRKNLRRSAQSDENASLVGISIGKSYGNAVQRNRAKRRIRAIAGELLPDLKEGYYIIVRPGIEFKKTGHDAASENIRCLFRKAGIVNV